MKLRLFDLHCDTPYRLYYTKSGLAQNGLHIALDRLGGLDGYVQLAAVCAGSGPGDEEAYAEFGEISSYFKAEIAKNGDRAAFVTDFAGIKAALEEKKAAFLLSVEGARLLAGDIGRLDALHAAGVRLLTLVWQGESCIGGAFDNDLPLTGFGRAVLARCFELGIVPDLSHASRPIIDEAIEMAKAAGKPVVASHSNAYARCVHPRNLTAAHFRAIAGLTGLVGISLAPQHLKSGGNCGIDDILRHIDYYLSQGGEAILCLGCDFDGIDNTPAGIESVAGLGNLADALARRNFSDELIDRIFFANAYNFFKRNLN